MKRLVTLAVLMTACVAYPGLSELPAVLSRILGNNNVGITVITSSGDSLTVRGDSVYDMASVVKFYQAAALSRVMSFEDICDGTVTIDPATLEKRTWSPMRTEAPDTVFRLTPLALLDYSLNMSDNNAADILFREFASPSGVDSILHSVSPTAKFDIRFSESVMYADSTGASNTSTPAAAASCMYRFFTSDTTASATLVKAIMARECPFGKSRIVAGIKPGVAKVFNKTGTGFNGDNGTPVAINDVAFVSYQKPDGYGCYAIAVFIKDFDGPAAEGEALIAEISEAVWNAVIVDEFIAMNERTHAPVRVGTSTSPRKQENKFSLGEALFEIASGLIYEAIDSKLSDY